METKEEAVNRIRRFNRFYTVLIGSLNRRFLGTDFSVTETRILFELAANNGCSANILAEELHIDKSYLSRIIKEFEKKLLISKTTDVRDRRASLITLTEKGTAAVSRLINETNQQIMSLIDTLSISDCAELCGAMDTITQLFSKKGEQNNE